MWDRQDFVFNNTSIESAQITQITCEPSEQTGVSYVDAGEVGVSSPPVILDRSFRFSWILWGYAFTEAGFRFSRKIDITYTGFRFSQCL
jgi:hypothetical protein